MYKLLFLAAFFTASTFHLYAQPGHSSSTPSYEYYIRITGINSKQDVENLQNSVIKKPGILFFMANRYPVRYFLMRSDHPINLPEFERLINNQSYAIQLFGEGKKGREQAVLLYNKTKAR